MALNVSINPKVVSIEDENANVYNDSYDNFLAHAAAYFTGLVPPTALQYQRTAGKEYTIVSLGEGQSNQVAADAGLSSEVDDVLANLLTIIDNQTEANTPEAELDLLPAPATHTVLYGQGLDFNLLYNKDVPPSYTLDILITSPHGFSDNWTVDVNSASEALELLFSQDGVWVLNLLGIDYIMEVQ